MKAISHFLLPAIVVMLLFSACKQDTPAQSSATGPTGNPAIDELSAKIAQTPKDPALYAARGKLFYENEGYDEAIQDLTQALKMDSTNVEYHHLLSDVYLDYLQSRLALRTMERAVALYPERIPSLLKLCELQYILKQYKASLQTIDRVMKIDPQNADGFLMMGLNLRELNDTDRAIKALQRCVEINPEITDAWINLGQISAKLKNKDAIRYFDSALRIKPNDVNTLHAKADFLRDENDLNGAIAIYKKLNTLDVQYEKGFYNAGLLYLDLDSVAQAREMFDLAIKINPINVQAYAYRGVANEGLGRKQDAKKDYETALRMAPDYEAAVEGLKRVQ